jgi:hypothetical protein
MVRWLLATALILTMGIPLFADQITIDFEGVPDSTSAATLYSAHGVTFSSGIVLVSGAFGGSLNEVDFPPVPPGQAVFVNEANTTTLTFSQPLLSFSGSFTYGGPISLNFYDAGNTLLTTLTSAFLTNIGTGGDPGSSPNELLSAANLANAVRVDILALNTDFTFDNLAITTAETVPVPEPGTLFLVSTAGILVFLLSRTRLRP